MLEYILGERFVDVQAKNCTSMLGLKSFYHNHFVFRMFFRRDLEAKRSLKILNNLQKMFDRKKS